MRFAQEEAIFYHELGKAIAQWSSVEFSLCRATAVCFMDRDIAKTVSKFSDFYLGFFSIENFRSKLQFSDVIIRRGLHSTEDIAEWNNLHGRLESLSKVRNHLAHWVVDQPTSPPESGNRMIGLSPRLQKAGMTPLGDKRRR